MGVNLVNGNVNLVNTVTYYTTGLMGGTYLGVNYGAGFPHCVGYGVYDWTGEYPAPSFVYHEDDPLNEYFTIGGLSTPGVYMCSCTTNLGVTYYLYVTVIAYSAGSYYGLGSTPQPFWKNLVGCLQEYA